jgi:hypothetical protein
VPSAIRRRIVLVDRDITAAASSRLRFNGCGRLYITVAEARRFLTSATPTPHKERLHG